MVVSSDMKVSMIEQLLSMGIVFPRRWGKTALAKSIEYMYKRQSKRILMERKPKEKHDAHSQSQEKRKGNH